MKAIGNIFLAWRKGRGSRRILVGVIKDNATQGTRFSYLKEGVEDAMKYGFNSYDGFPDLEKVYSENVIEIFGQRIMRSERNDIDDFFEFWKIDKKYKENNLYMLAYTQGLLPTDNFEFLADFSPVKDLSFISEISGLSKTKLSPDSIAVGDIINYQSEPNNQYDKYAVKLFKGDLFLGYVKKIHCKVFSKKNKLNIKVHRIEKNGIVNRVFLHIYN